MTPDLARPDGTLRHDPGLPYVLTDNGVEIIGSTVLQIRDLRLVHLARHPWRLKQAVYGRQSDGWIGNDATYAYFGPERRRGTLEVDVSRTAFCPPNAPGTDVEVRVGPVALDQQRTPVVRHPIAVERFHLQNCRRRALIFDVAPPVAVQVHVADLVRLADYGFSDGRTVGATVGFSFTTKR